MAELGSFSLLLALVLCLYAIAGLETTKTVNFGEQIKIGSYTLTFKCLHERPEGKNRGYILVLGTLLTVWAGKGSELGPKYYIGRSSEATAQTI